MDIIDETTIERRGVKFRVSVVRDEDTTPDEFDCYSDEQKAAWREGRWEFIGAIVALYDMDGVDASLWAIEYGDLPLDIPGPDGEDLAAIGLAQIVDNYADDLVAECIALTLARARRHLADLAHLEAVAAEPIARVVKEHMTP